MNTITREKLLKAGFDEKFVDSSTIYTRKGFSILHNGIAWYPCTILSEEVKIGNVYLETMEEIEKFIIENKNI